MLYRCKSDRYRASTDNGVVDAYIMGKDFLPLEFFKNYDFLSDIQKARVRYFRIKLSTSEYTHTIPEGDVLWLHEGHMCVCDGKRFHQEFHPIVKVSKRKRTPGDKK